MLSQTLRLQLRTSTVKVLFQANVCWTKTSKKGGSSIPPSYLPLQITMTTRDSVSYLHNQYCVHYAWDEQSCTILHLPVVGNAALPPDSSCLCYVIGTLEGVLKTHIATSCKDEDAFSSAHSLLHVNWDMTAKSNCEHSWIKLDMQTSWQLRRMWRLMLSLLSAGAPTSCCLYIPSVPLSDSSWATRVC